MKVEISGSGLIGTSMGLALHRVGHQIRFTDLVEENAVLAAARIESAEFEGKADLFVSALPSDLVGEDISRAQKLNLAHMFIDVASIKTNVQQNVKTFGDEISFCGTHPMAGSERSGPVAARSDLFEGRAWVYTPSEMTQQSLVEIVEEVISECGALPIRMTPSEHDSAVAAVSHTPQVLASLLASRLSQVPQTHLAIAGSGLRDTIRIAGSEPSVWQPILLGNREAIADFLEPIGKELNSFIDKLRKDQSFEPGELIERGAKGRARLPGKHGERARRYDKIAVLLPDRPGQLGALFATFSTLQVNVEDISMEHSPGLPSGLVEITIAPGTGSDLISSLSKAGWRAYAIAPDAN